MIPDGREDHDEVVPPRLDRDRFVDAHAIRVGALRVRPQHVIGQVVDALQVVAEPAAVQPSVRLDVLRRLEREERALVRLGRLRRHLRVGHEHLREQVAEIRAERLGVALEARVQRIEIRDLQEHGVRHVQEPAPLRERLLELCVGPVPAAVASDAARLDARVVEPRDDLVRDERDRRGRVVHLTAAHVARRRPVRQDRAHRAGQAIPVGVPDRPAEHGDLHDAAPEDVELLPEGGERVLELRTGAR